MSARSYDPGYDTGGIRSNGYENKDKTREFTNWIKEQFFVTIVRQRCKKFQGEHFAIDKNKLDRVK